jgi:hypothetical protein
LISIIEATDRFRSRLDQMIYTRRSFVVLIIRVPRRAIHPSTAHKFSRRGRDGNPLFLFDLTGISLPLSEARAFKSELPMPPMRLMLMLVDHESVING